MKGAKVSRIRSIHPGFFTDEHIVATSMAARLLFLGLGVEADDKGVFEWKPLTIKMRIFPGDNVDVPTCLAELVDTRAIIQFSHGGKLYGAIRNFRKFQRPKSPNDIYPAPRSILVFVGMISEINTDEDDIISEIGSDELGQFPQKGEIPPQMEDGGDKMEDGGDNTPLPPKKKRKSACSDDFRPDNIPDQIWSDWKKARKGKPVTASVISRIESEAGKIGWTLAQAITEAAENGWMSFKADWINQRKSNGQQRNQIDRRDGFARALDDAIDANARNQ